jgi:hypothetical protein
MCAGERFVSATAVSLDTVTMGPTIILDPKESDLV